MGEQEVAGLAVAKRPPDPDIVLLDEVLNRGIFVDHSQLRRHDREQLLEVFARRIGNLDLIGNSPQEGAVDKVLRLEVR